MTMQARTDLTIYWSKNFEPPVTEATYVIRKEKRETRRGPAGNDDHTGQHLNQGVVDHELPGGDMKIIYSVTQSNYEDLQCLFVCV